MKLNLKYALDQNLKTVNSFERNRRDIFIKILGKEEKINSKFDLHKISKCSQANKMEVFLS